MFIDEHRDRFGVEPICRVLEVSASAYYERAKGIPSDRELADRQLLAEIRQVHAESYEAYGSRRTWKELLRRGSGCARCTVERLMAQNGICGAKRRGRPWRTTRPDLEAARSPDLVDRDFSATAPDRLWVCDFTYLRSWQGLMFFAFVVDVFSRKIVGWQLATHMRTDLVLDALRMALGLRAPGADVALVHHSDRGSQYTSADYTQTLDDAGVLASLGSTGDAYDNALAESFVDSFKTELIADRIWRTHEQAELAIVEWVGWFNERRLHSSIGDIPPVEHEQAYWAQLDLDPPDRSPSVLSPQPADALSAPRLEPVGPIEAGEHGRSPQTAAPPPVCARPTDSLRPAADEEEQVSTTLPLTTTGTT